MKDFIDGFKAFIMRGNVVDLAIGVVIGTAFNAVTNSLVTNIITPPLGLLTGKINFADLALGLGGTVKIQYGLFIQAIITFLITAVALFLIVRFITRVEAIAARKKNAEAAAPPAPADTPEVSILKEIRDTLKANSSTKDTDTEDTSAKEPEIPTIKD
jgi:large conductance mechanosensitive channel